LVLACALTLVLANASARAQSADALMARVGDWVHEFVEQFANVVAEEDYVPSVRSLGSRLTSDYLWCAIRAGDRRAPTPVPPTISVHRRRSGSRARTPTILRDGSRDQPTHGIAWVLEATGRIVRTEVEIGERSRLTRTVVLTTAFKMDDALRIYVPVTMQDGFTMKDSAGVKGMAYYTRFRRFTVRTTEAIDLPAR
jgi:hypothetical protein